MTKLDDLEPKKRAAVLLMVEYTAQTKMENRKSLAQIADEAGISERQLFRWRTEDDEFQKAFDSVVNLKLREIRVDDALVKLVDRGSVKACELVLKSQGKLIEKQEVNANIRADVDIASQSNEELLAELEILKARVKGDD